MSKKKIVELTKISDNNRERTYRMNDGSIEVWSEGTVAWRNNNPGNLKFVFAGSLDPTVKTRRSKEQALFDAKQRYDGVVALDLYGNAIFQDIESGRAAQIQYLRKNFGEMDAHQLIRRYSVKDYSGNPHWENQENVIYRTAEKQGLNIQNKKVSNMSDKELSALTDGIGRFEGWKEGDVIHRNEEAEKKSVNNRAENTPNTPLPFPKFPNNPFPWQPSYDPKWKGVPFLPNPFVPDGFGGWFDNGHECLKPWGHIFDPFRRGKYHVYDPLALDLDGDGIETVATKGFAGALFDHRSQGIRTATGWVSADDGLLVRDLNGNGIIDNGAELFGDNTKLADGSFAKHGYAALAELDSNGDGIVSAADAAFQTLRVWQDLNQDGISQTNELRTLEELGIQSLDVAYKDANKNLGNGNTLAQQGSYTKTDGTTAQAGDLLLAADNLYSRFKDKMLLTAIFEKTRFTHFQAA